MRPPLRLFMASTPSRTVLIWYYFTVRSSQIAEFIISAGDGISFLLSYALRRVAFIAS